MDHFIKIVSWMSDKLRTAGAFSLAAMMLVTCADVVGRFFNKPILGSVEFVGFFATLTAAMALPYTHKMDAHIGVDLFVRLLPERFQNCLYLVTTVISFVLFGIVTWRMAVYADTIYKSGEVSMTLKLPEYIIIYIVAACFLVFFLLIVQDLFSLIKKLKKKIPE